MFAHVESGRSEAPVVLGAAAAHVVILAECLQSLLGRPDRRILEGHRARDRDGDERRSAAFQHAV